MRIKIFQINLDSDSKGVKFKPLSEKLINPSIYKNVYYGDVEAETLEDVYKIFNEDRPATHQGHRLSVSDVIEVIDGEGKVNNGTYYCNKIGFKDINFDVSKIQEMEGMDVVYVTPNHSPLHIKIRNSLKDMQNAVGGLIEPIYNDDQTISVANEESKILQMPPNRTLENGIIINGPFFICGDGGENFISLSKEEINKYMDMFSQPEKFDFDTIEPNCGYTIYGI
jgi:hypothetical protein